MNKKIIVLFLIVFAFGLVGSHQVFAAVKSKVNVRKTQKAPAKNLVPKDIPTLVPLNHDPSPSEIAAKLNPEAKAFYMRSLQIRSQYAPYSEYKNFVSAKLMDPDGYIYIQPNYGFELGPDYYANPASTIPRTFYRYVKDCGSKETIERQLIDTSKGYNNYVGGSRYKEQCVLDGSADTYYVESLTKLE